MDNLALKNIIGSVVQDYLHFIKTLHDLLYYTYPEIKLKNIINLLITISNNIIMKLNQLYEEENYEYLINEVILYENLYLKLNKLLMILELPRRENVPISITYLLDLFSSEEFDFLIIPIFTNNFLYMDFSRILKDYFEEIELEKEKSPLTEEKSINLLFYPLSYKNNIVSIILLAHEISHYFEMKYNISKLITEKIELDPKRIEEISRNLIREVFRDYDRPLEPYINWNAVMAWTMKRITNVLNNWIREIFCDLLAYKIIGPAYIVVFFEYFLSKFKPETGSESHPPTMLRILILIKEFNADGFRDKLLNSRNRHLITFVKLIDNLKKYLDNFSINEETISSREGYLFYYVYEILDEIIDSIIKKSREISYNIRTYNMDELINEIPKLLNDFKNLVVPCEVKPGILANPISIINAAILFKNTLFDDVFNNYIKDKLDLKKEEFAFKINELALKGVELCLIGMKMK